MVKRHKFDTAKYSVPPPPPACSVASPIFKYRNKEEDSFEYWIYRGPFHNCQIFTIGSAANILKPPVFIDDDRVAKHPNLSDEEILEHFVQASIKVGKKLMLIDVYQTLIEDVKRVFKDRPILFESPYQNLTGSNMVMFLIKVRD